MKLHLPARLRSALLACLSVVAPLTGTLATGALATGAAVVALSLSEAVAAEVTIPSGSTAVYNAANTYVLQGGTLRVDAGQVTSSVTIGAADSTVSLGDGAVLSPLRVSLAEGVQSYKLVGTGTYDLASATSMYGANVSNADWNGTVSITNATGVGNFNLNNYGNAYSTVRLSGVAGWLSMGTTFNPTLLLEDTAGSSALNVTDGSSNKEYVFSSVRGNGTFERGGTKFAGAVTYTFQGDVSGWKGNFLNNFGQTTLVFRGSATEINLASITHNAGYAMNLNFTGAGATVVNSPIRSTAGGAIDMTIDNAGGVTFAKNAAISSLTVNGAMTVASGAQMSVSGAASLNGTVTVNGTLNLDGGVTMNTSIVNNGALNISGAMVVNSSNLAQRPVANAVGDLSFSEGDNGIQTSGDVEYTVIEQGSGAKLNISGAALSFDGNQKLQMTPDGKVVRAADPASTRYWVNSGEVSLNSTNAASYYMNGSEGVLLLNKTDAAAQGSVLVAVEGREGKIKITADTTLTGEMASKAACDLVVSGVVLKLGESENQAVNISSFSSVTLEDNAMIRIESQSANINNLTVAESGGRIDVRDTQGVPSTNPYVFTGVTTLHGTLTRTPGGGWGNGMLFEQLSGKGTLEYENNPSEQSYVAINSLQGFTGNLSFTQTNGNTAAYDVHLDSGAVGVSMNTLTVGCIVKPADFRNMNVELNAERGLTIAQLNIRSNTNLSVDGASGLAANVVVHGVDNLISVRGDSALNLAALNVTTDGVLSIVGNISALAMNQAGTLTLSDMRLVDGAALVYGADESVLRITDANLLGNINVDLNSLTNTQTLAIANGSGLNLGIDSSVDKTRIGILSDNVRDAVLDNSGETWKLVSGVVSQYWEAAGGSGNWNTTDANWAFRDEATADQTFIGGTDAIFSGDENGTVTITSPVDVQNVEIRSGSYTFNNTSGSALVVKNNLIVESKNNLFGGDVEVKGALLGEGHLVVTGDLSLGKSSEIGDMFVTGTVAMTGTDTDTQSNTDLTVTGTTAACAGLENVGKLTLRGDATMTISPTAAGTTVAIKSLAGTGTVSVQGADNKLNLTSGASAIGSIEASSLILDKGVTLDAGTLATPEVNITFAPEVIDGGTILSADSTTGATKLNMNVASVDDLKKLTNGQVVTIAAIAQPGGVVTGELFAPPAPNPETIITKWTDKEGFSVTANLRGFGYELKVSDDNKQVTMVVSRDNTGWIGEATDVWTQGAQDGWQDGFIPDETYIAAGFFGAKAYSVVKVDNAGVSTALVDVDIAKDALADISYYRFEGGQVTADNMVIGQGRLEIANTTLIRESTQLYSNGELTVAEGGNLEVSNSVSLTDKVSLSVEKGGEFSVGSTFTSAETASIENAGKFTVKELSVQGSIDNMGGELHVLVGGSVGAVEGGVVHLFDSNANCSLEIGSLNVDELTILGENSVVKLTKDSVIGSLSVKDGVDGVSLTSTAAVTLNAAAAGGANLTATALTLNAIGNDFGELRAPMIAIDLKEGSLSTEEAALNVTSLAVEDTVGITLTQATISSLPLNDAGVIAAGDYKLISGVGAFSASNFSVAEEVLQEIKRRGVTAGVAVAGDDLVLSLDSIDGGMVWDTSAGQLTNNGYEVPTGAGLYKALDYVEHVLVPGNKTIDLTAEGVGSAASDATEAAVGLIIRNLDGGGRLVLKGDAAAEDKELPDVATLLSDKTAETPVALVADSVRVNIGLPTGAEGMLAGDDSADSVVLASAELENGAVLQVNADAVVSGQTDLGEATALVVEDGSVFTTQQLDGGASATVSGRININGVGGAYNGVYGDAGAEIELQRGAFQSVRAGKGLSLLLSGGEGTLDLAGAEAELVKLGVGTAPGASEALRSELVIANVTLNNDAGRVEHHTLNLTGTGSYIADSELTVSLGAEETARTLGTDQAPLILNGQVNVSNSTVCLTMVTTNENLRALDVNTDAPMQGAKLATLAAETSVSGANTVELGGSRAVMNVVNKYYTNARLDANGDVLVDRVTDYYAAQSSGMSETGQVGVGMLDKVLVKLNPQAKTQEYPDLNNVLNALDDALVGGNVAAADELASAVTGVSAAAMGAALVGDMERQLRTIRNRTTTMGVDQGTVNHNMPYYNAWINAEYDNRQLESDGMLAGYDYSVTGGTFGFDVDVTPRFVCGFALSALTGDVSSEGPDKLDADVDSYYLTAFGRTTYRRWTHTFVASVGKSDLSVDRVVSFSGGSYSTKGETEALSFGAMYELGYVFALDADANTCLQPVINIAVAHSSMDAYTESGSDAALHISGVDMTAVTIGMGARLQAVVGQSTFNRSSIFESRALLKVNAGDRDAEVETALTSLPTASGKVSSAERGPVSLELGAGITVPIGANSGAIYVDGSAELGAEYTELSASVGYRMSF